jgi:hypothetical protein
VTLVAGSSRAGLIPGQLGKDRETDLIAEAKTGVVVDHLVLGDGLAEIRSLSVGTEPGRWMRTEDPNRGLEKATDIEAGRSEKSCRLTGVCHDPENL